MIGRDKDVLTAFEDNVLNGITIAFNLACCVNVDFVWRGRELPQGFLQGFDSRVTIGFPIGSGIDVRPILDVFGVNFRTFFMDEVLKQLRCRCV